MCKRGFGGGFGDSPLCIRRENRIQLVLPSDMSLVSQSAKRSATYRSTTAFLGRLTPAWAKAAATLLRAEATALTRPETFDLGIYNDVIGWWPGTESNRRRQPFQGLLLKYRMN
jgi:hypothetical protein